MWVYVRGAFGLVDLDRVKDEVMQAVATSTWIHCACMIMPA